MDPPPHNHNVSMGGHRSTTSVSTSQQPQAMLNQASGGERSAGTARSIQPGPLTSGGLPESQLPEQCSPELLCLVGWEPSYPPTLPSSPPEQTSAETRDFDVHSFIQMELDPGGQEAATCFFHASEQPPITPESLAELDMPRIINNPKLRHDVNFDRELSFRPNLDGSKGRQKMRLAEEYWKALEAELFLYNYVLRSMSDPQQQENEAYWQAILAHSQKRLAGLFHAIREILKTLVPDCDQKTIEDRLDVELIMRQILAGMFNLIDLGNWLAKIIKNHCAPMRDVEVDAMQRTIKRSVEDEKPFRLVNGIRQLLTLLENMKLDVANHQIRHMRPLLVEDTVNFQRRYNAHRISMNKIDVPRSRLWLEREIDSMRAESGTTPAHLEALTSALFRGLLLSDHFNSNSAYPPTFYLDIERLRLFRNDFHHRIYQEICKEVLFEILPKQATQAQITEAVTALHHCVDTILSGCHGRLGANAEYVATEIMRLVLWVEQKEGQCDSDLFDDAQQRLESDLRTQSPTFKKHAQDLVDSLLPRLQASVAKHAKCPALRLQDLLLPPSPPNITHNLPLGYAAPGFGAICDHPTALPIVDPDEEVIRRFTHVLVLHWHVWAELVYLTPSSDDSSDDDSAPTPPSTGNSSPTVPVAHAVYEPGKKWLPVALTVTDVPSGLPTPAASPSADTSGHSQSSDTDDESDRPCHSGASSNAEHSS